MYARLRTPLLHDLCRFTPSLRRARLPSHAPAFSDAVGAGASDAQNHTHDDGERPGVVPPRSTKAALLADHLRSHRQSVPAGLYLVATPIGNLEDVTIRALRVLSAADTVLAEDCRRTRILLDAYGVAAARLTSYHMHNEAQRSLEVVELLRRGQVVALVSDAGTPGVSDPGAAAVAAAVGAGFRVVPVPGASAALAAVTASGLPTSEFHFVGFLPAKGVARRRQLGDLREHVQATMVFYVPPHGLVEVLEDMVEVLGGHRRCCVTRELTKIHEHFHRATLAATLQHYAAAGVKGEVTVCVEGSSDDEMLNVEQRQRDPRQRMQQLLDDGVSVSAASKLVATEFGMRKKESYALALQLDDERRSSVQSS